MSHRLSLRYQHDPHNQLRGFRIGQEDRGRLEGHPLKRCHLPHLPKGLEAVASGHYQNAPLVDVSANTTAIGSGAPRRRQLEFRTLCVYASQSTSYCDSSMSSGLLSKRLGRHGIAADFLLLLGTWEAGQLFV